MHAREAREAHNAALFDALMVSHDAVIARDAKPYIELYTGFLQAWRAEFKGFSSAEAERVKQFWHDSQKVRMAYFEARKTALAELQD